MNSPLSFYLPFTFSLLYRNSQLLAKFKLCPKDSNRCRNAGEYVVAMDSFVSAYGDILGVDQACASQQETCIASCQDMSDGYQNQQAANGDDAQGDDNAAAQQNNNNYNNNGQQQQGNSYSNYAKNNYQYGYGGNNRNLEEQNADGSYYFDFDGCLAECMDSAGMSKCSQQSSSQSSMSGLEDLVQCTEIADSVYVGAQCKNGGVYLGTFTDSSCSKKAAEGTYENIVSYFPCFEAIFVPIFFVVLAIYSSSVFSLFRILEWCVSSHIQLGDKPSGPMRRRILHKPLRGRWKV